MNAGVEGFRHFGPPLKRLEWDGIRPGEGVERWMNRLLIEGALKSRETVPKSPARRLPLPLFIVGSYRMSGS